MMDDRHVDRWLSELADADRRLEPPRDLEARVLAAWDARAQRAGGGRRNWRPAIAVAGALSGIAAVVAVLIVSDRAPAPNRAHAPAPRSVVQAPVQTVRGSLGAELGPVAPPAPAPRRGGGRRPAAPRERAAGRADVREPPAVDGASVEAASGDAGMAASAPPALPRPLAPGPFIAVAPDATFDGLGALQLSRVRVPRGVLVDLGVLRDGVRNGDSVPADVVFGEDGLARAIRLASSSGRVVR